MQVVPGELLPWKGEWLEVVDVRDETIVLRKRDKQTAGAKKRDEARKRWIANHPDAKEVR